METEANALLAGLCAAQEEYQHALAAANQMRGTLDRARRDYEEARAAEKASEDELARAADTLARGLQHLDVDEHRDGDATGPKTAVPTIVDSLVEYHANIGCYQCYLFLDTHKESDNHKEIATAFDAAELSVRVEFPRVELTYRSNNSCVQVAEDVQAVWCTEIERNVDVSQCTVEDKEDHWYLRLPILLSDKQPLGGFSSFTQVSPMELRPESYTSVCCRGCNALLLGGKESTSIEKVLPLPSANWMDMFDFWGAGIGAFEHIPRDDIHAQKHRVLVGESYILLHASDLVEEARVADRKDEAAVAPGENAKEERKWLPLVCAACLERVGLSSVEQPETVRMHKHLICARPHLESAAERRGAAQEQEERNVFATYTIDSILSAKLLEMADSDGKFRFVLTSFGEAHDHDFSCLKEKSHSPPDTATVQDKPLTELQLQLLSWDTMIKQQDTNKFSRVLKVLYGPCQPTIPGLQPSHKVSLPPVMSSAIAQRLRTSSTLLPSSLRTFNRMNVGYLFA